MQRYQVVVGTSGVEISRGGPEPIVEEVDIRQPSGLGIPLAVDAAGQVYGGISMTPLPHPVLLTAIFPKQETWVCRGHEHGCQVQLLRNEPRSVDLLLSGNGRMFFCREGADWPRITLTKQGRTLDCEYEASDHSSMAALVVEGVVAAGEFAQSPRANDSVFGEADTLFPV